MQEYCQSGLFNRKVGNRPPSFFKVLMLRASQSPSEDGSAWLLKARAISCPEEIRCDNGPEYISDCLLAWAKKRGILIWHIQPGKPQQNAFIEQYNRTVRQEWLGQYLFESRAQLQD